MKRAHSRLESLDVFRGLTVAGMILVNNPGDWNETWPPLVHAAWHGCTFADLVFPFFIFILGVAMPFAFSRRVEAGYERRHLYARVLRRAILLFLLGLILNATAAFPEPESLRIPGVLQRIALVYLAAAFVVLHAGTFGRIVTAVLLLLVHWAVLALVPAGGQGAAWLSVEHNVAGVLDKLVFGRHTLLATGDPEGLLGTLSAIALALFGVLAGQWMRTGQSPARRVTGLAAGGLAAVALGLCWSVVLPFNKSLWTGSFALFTAGLGGLALAASYWVIDVRAIRGWARPFVWLGVNPLATYFLSELTGDLIDRSWLPTLEGRTTVKTWLYWGILRPAAGPWFGERGISLLFAVITVAFWTAVAGLLYRKKIRIQV
jgi:predicted acyltransferase